MTQTRCLTPNCCLLMTKIIDSLHVVHGEKIRNTLRGWQKTIRNNRSSVIDNVYFDSIFNLSRFIVSELITIFFCFTRSTINTKTTSQTNIEKCWQEPNMHFGCNVVVKIKTINKKRHSISDAIYTMRMCHLPLSQWFSSSHNFSLSQFSSQKWKEHKKFRFRKLISVFYFNFPLF